jgi:DNA-binding transcriptional regulator YhcF (GntR family)
MFDICIVTIDRNHNTPLYQQLVRQIRELINSGQLKEEEKLPPIRKLAQDLK